MNASSSHTFEKQWSQWSCLNESAYLHKQLSYTILFNVANMLHDHKICQTHPLNVTIKLFFIYKLIFNVCTSLTYD